MNGTGIMYFDGDDSNAVESLFGKPMQATQDYIAQSVQQYVHNIGQTASNIATNVMSRFQDISSSINLQRVANMRSRLNSVWQSNSIRRLPDLGSIQEAPVVMQRWIMAAPRLRSSYNRDGCSGYDGKYIDNRPGGVAETHYDYRRVMNGIVEDKSYTNYHEVLLDRDDILNIMEKAAIKATWDVINGIVEETNMDPTSPYNEMMG